MVCYPLCPVTAGVLFPLQFAMCEIFMQKKIICRKTLIIDITSLLFTIWLYGKFFL